MTVTKTPITNSFQTRSFIIGSAFGAMIVLVVTAVIVVPLSLKGRKITTSLSHWSYYEQDTWTGVCKTGKSQSPIALNSSSSNKTVTLSAPNFQNSFYYENIIVENNGHSVSVKVPSYISTKPEYSGGGLTGRFTFDNVHFHWPSEHIIDGIQYPLEGHFVFFESKYANLSTALENSGGVTVVAVLFEESNDTTHNSFRAIDDAVKIISKNAGYSIYSMNGITFNDFFPKDNSTFFKYTGSLTTPNCVEGINWIVFKNPSTILPEDLKDLTDIYTNDHLLLEFNNRLLQNINERVIYLQEESR